MGLRGFELSLVEEQCVVAPGVTEISAVTAWERRHASELPVAEGLYAWVLS